MKNTLRRAFYALIGVALVVLATLYFVPLVSDRIVVCPPNGNCPYYYSQSESLVSVTYWALDVGGRLAGGHYQVAYLPGWTCRQASSEATTTVTLTNGTATTTRVVTGSGLIECTENVITVA